MLAVLQAFLGTVSLEDCLIDVVNRGGDADTTGAIAGGRAYGLQGIPPRWLNALNAAITQLCSERADALIAQAYRPDTP